MSNLNPEQFAGLPNWTAHHKIDSDPVGGPQYWHTDIQQQHTWANKTLAPDHPLHTAQDWLGDDDENVYIKHPDINKDSELPAGKPWETGRPMVAHFPGVGDVVGHGHHRIAAARIAGRPIDVDYTVAKPDYDQARNPVQFKGIK